MSRALIGHTGFVGGNLAAQSSFDALFNSRNFREMQGRAFDEVWCCGVQAMKWWANRNPDDDWQRILDLLDVLSTIRCGRFVLVSTVDVYMDPTGCDEATPPRDEGLHAYGLHRLRVERFVSERFQGSLTLRLPGLFGPGLKKNAIHDLATDNAVESLDGSAIFQFYDLAGLHADAARALDAGLCLANLVTEPLRLGDVAQKVFSRALPDRGTGIRYDVGTMHGATFGRAGSRYLSGSSDVLSALARFAAERRDPA